MKIMSWFEEWAETFEFVQCKPELSLLPMELLVQIFSFLNPSDLMCVGLTCHRFLDALQHRKFSKNWILNFSERYSTQFSIPVYLFITCSRLFPAIMLYCGQVDDYAFEDFWIKCGEKLTELHFLSGILRKEEFVNVGKYTRNLEILKIEANNMFKSWVIQKFAYERRIVFPNCRHVSLARNNFLSIDVFEYIMATSPNIRGIDLSNCLQLMNPPERNRFLDYVLSFIRLNSGQIDSLDFSNTVTDDMFLDNLGRIDGLQLKELHLTFMGSTKNSFYGLPVLIRNQPLLEKFDLTASPCANDLLVRLIANHMKNIRILLLKKCHNLTDNGVREIVKMVHLERLEISDCNVVTDAGIMDGVLSGTPKPSLKDLSLGLLQTLTEPVLIRLSYFYDNLSFLDLGGVSIAVTDSSMQMILRHMRFLRKLNVESCCKLTDYGFTGVYFDVYARRHHSIRNLRGLQVLKCSGLYKLTDFTLVDAFVLPELKEVCFSRCNFTLKGITALVKNCPALELLDLSECKAVDDECVQIIASSLPRLKTLKLNRCEQITEKCFQTFYENCTELRNIFLRNCKLQFDPSDHLMYMSSLRKVVT